MFSIGSTVSVQLFPPTPGMPIPACLGSSTVRGPSECFVSAEVAMVPPPGHKIEMLPAGRCTGVGSWSSSPSLLNLAEVELTDNDSGRRGMAGGNHLIDNEIV